MGGKRFLSTPKMAFAAAIEGLKESKGKFHEHSSPARHGKIATDGIGHGGCG